ncbi:hypothetical protein Tsp_06696, partial [Trichinella spiralis]|uniref:hypothetical protein n=1 Tax=Trichinella spiralis TaxID=6334 RepID=UPI0001EFBFEC
MALPSNAPEICVASLITGSTCAGFRIHHTSLVVRVAISSFGVYFCRHPHCGVAYHMLRIENFTALLLKIRDHVDKYVITKHYHLLMPLSLATLGKNSFYFWIQRGEGKYNCESSAQDE